MNVCILKQLLILFDRPCCFEALLLVVVYRKIIWLIKGRKIIYKLGNNTIIRVMNMLHLIFNFFTGPPNKRFASFWRFCKWNWFFSIGWNWIFYLGASKRGKIETQKLYIANWMWRCSWTFCVAWWPWAARFCKSFVSTFQSLENILWIESVKEWVAKSQTSFVFQFLQISPILL